MRKFLNVIQWISLVFLTVATLICSRWWINGFFRLKVPLFIASLILVLIFIVDKFSMVVEYVKKHLPTGSPKSYDDMSRDELIRAHYRALKKGDDKLAEKLMKMIKEEDDYVRCFDMKT